MVPPKTDRQEALDHRIELVSYFNRIEMAGKKRLRDGEVGTKLLQVVKVAHHVQNAELIGIGVIGIIPSGRSAIAALVGRDDVVTRSRKR